MIARHLLRLIALLLAALSQPAAAAYCEGADWFNFRYSTQPAATLQYNRATPYSYTATNSAGASRTFTVQINQNGLISTLALGNQMPNISTQVVGFDQAQTLALGGSFGARTASLAGTTNVVTVTFTFPTPVHSFAIQIHDVDYNVNQFRDWLQITGANGTSTYTPVISTPWGNGNLTGQVRTSTNSSVTVGPTASPFSLSSSQVTGNSGNVNGQDRGTVTADFAQPVTRVILKYGNYPLTGTETATGQQAIGIAGISFCPMPAISLSKTSTPSSSKLGAFNIPDNDVIYTITVNNTGGSSTDANSIVIRDVIPANMTFLNLPFDGTTTLPVKLTGPAGVTLTTANLAYRQSGTTTFDYTPAGVSDPLVAEVRIIPDGVLPPRSTMSVQFRAKIN